MTIRFSNQLVAELIQPFWATSVWVDLAAERLFLLITGSVNAALVPYWLHWLRQLYPHLVTRAAVTRSAERFVTVEAVSQLLSGHVWPADRKGPRRSPAAPQYQVRANSPVVQRREEGVGRIDRVLLAVTAGDVAADARAK